MLVQGHQSLVLCFLESVAEEVDGVGNNGSQQTRTVGILTLMEAFLNLPVSFLILFSGKKQNLQIIRHWIKGILLYMLLWFMLSVAAMQ